MRLRSRKGIAVLVIVVLLVLSGIIGAYYLTVVQRPTPFVAKLAIVGTGTAHLYDNFTGAYVNLSLTFTSPALVDPDSLVISLVCRTTCPTWGTFAPPNATSLNLTYDANMYPHWVARPGGGYWTGAFAEATNPDGNLVGGTLTSVTTAEKLIQSGAVLTIGFADVIGYPQPFEAIVLAYEGHPGSADVPLT